MKNSRLLSVFFRAPAFSFQKVVDGLYLKNCVGKINTMFKLSVKVQYARQNLFYFEENKTLIRCKKIGEC